MRKTWMSITMLVASFSAYAGPNYQNGKLANLTAVTAGIMIKLDSGLPGNCTNTPYGWLLIKQQHTAIISVVLTAWAAGNKTGTVYTSGLENGNGYCLVNQYDPVN